MTLFNEFLLRGIGSLKALAGSSGIPFASSGTTGLVAGPEAAAAAAAAFCNFCQSTFGSLEMST
eukprot:CAMPEP_0206143772 /NCGR_PEP_ID=MMETSP1473-20131121/21763_1 /ASSEMBLY_ACC=CAM_ASM_001109 /TAXON_ID=1461547 /ORGANISM="Stichococcus sp, Strain RCC1054" /LENGTH=63 /DNA_ID=CAMNT_0053539327 /DNA_START=137 /DNA_END=328 /DNA_ORIENTATION=-